MDEGVVFQQENKFCGHWWITGVFFSIIESGTLGTLIVCVPSLPFEAVMWI